MAPQALLASLALAFTLASVVWVLMPLRQRSPRWPAAIALGVPLVALSLYFSLGTPKALDAPGPDAAHPQQQADLQAMVGQLQARLAQAPNDLQGWFMLARSHQVLEQLPQSAQAYRRALALAPADVDLLADLADVLAAAAHGDLEGEPRQLLEQGLKQDAAHAKTRLLLAAADFRIGRLDDARQHWTALLRTQAPGSEAAAVAQAGLDRLHQRRALEAASAPPADGALIPQGANRAATSNRAGS